LKSIYVSADEVLPVFEAGKGRLQVLVPHLPRKESVYLRRENRCLKNH
jgi:hypothetical protein